MTSDRPPQIGPRRSVAVVGLGAMGSRVAARLLTAGYRVVVWNRTPEKAFPLVERGAGHASSPADAAAHAEAVITMVADPGALRAVAQGREGVLAGIQRGATWLEMSTVGPHAISQLARDLPPETRLVDAPVLGSISEAEGGKLEIFVGGQEEDFRRLRRMLSELGTPRHVGPLGAGAAAKLVTNLTLLNVLGVLGEALALARHLGLDPQVAWDVLAQTPMAGQAERRRRAVESDDYPERFSLTLARKDADLIVEAARGAGIDLRITGATRAWFRDAEATGLGRRDYSAVLRHIVRQQPAPGGPPGRE